jgi:hypothetical protein
MNYSDYESDLDFMISDPLRNQPVETSSSSSEQPYYAPLTSVNVPYNDELVSVDVPYDDDQQVNIPYEQLGSVDIPIVNEPQPSLSELDEFLSFDNNNNRQEQEYSSDLETENRNLSNRSQQFRKRTIKNTPNRTPVNNVVIPTNKRQSARQYNRRGRQKRVPVFGNAQYNIDNRYLKDSVCIETKGAGVMAPCKNLITDYQYKTILFQQNLIPISHLMSFKFDPNDLKNFFIDDMEFYLTIIIYYIRANLQFENIPAESTVNQFGNNILFILDNYLNHCKENNETHELGNSVVQVINTNYNLYQNNHVLGNALLKIFNFYKTKNWYSRNNFSKLTLLKKLAYIIHTSIQRLQYQLIAFQPIDNPILTSNSDIISISGKIRQIDFKDTILLTLYKRIIQYIKKEQNNT